MNNPTDNKPGLVDAVERIQRMFDEANTANDEAAWEAARVYLVAWFAIHGGSKAILSAHERMREALTLSTSCLCSVRKNYEEEGGLWEDVSRAIKDGNGALQEDNHDPD